jgi:hypothetical protein
MTRKDAQLVVKYFDLVKWWAEGGQLDHALHNHKGEFVSWQPVMKDLHVACLDKLRKSNRPKEIIGRQTWGHQTPLPNPPSEQLLDLIMQTLLKVLACYEHLQDLAVRVKSLEAKVSRKKHK